jgi:hypothetical protein
MLATFLAVVALVGAQQERPAASAALASVAGDDPVAANHATCAYRADSPLILLQARFDCIVKTCDSFLASVEVDHTLGDGWRFRIVRSDLSLAPKVRAGPTAPGPRPDRPICG